VDEVDGGAGPEVVVQEGDGRGVDGVLASHNRSQLLPGEIEGGRSGSWRHRMDRRRGR
jgi:hypothetical protein